MADAKADCGQPRGGGALVCKPTSLGNGSRIAETAQRFSALQPQLLCAAIHFFYRHIRSDPDVLQRMEGNYMFKHFFEVQYHNKADLNRIFPDSVHDCSPAHVCSFILSILHQGIFSVSAFIVSIIYLSRFKESSHITLHACTWRPLFLTALLLADKMWEDKPVRNSSLAKLFPVLSNVELNKMEGEFLGEVRFNVIVTPDLFCSFCEKLLAEQVHQEIIRCVESSEFVATLHAEQNAEGPPFHHEEEEDDDDEPTCAQEPEDRMAAEGGASHQQQQQQASAPQPAAAAQKLPLRHPQLHQWTAQDAQASTLPSSRKSYPGQGRVAQNAGSQQSAGWPERATHSAVASVGGGQQTMAPRSLSQQNSQQLQAMPQQVQKVPQQAPPPSQQLSQQALKHPQAPLPAAPQQQQQMTQQTSQQRQQSPHQPAQQQSPAQQSQVPQPQQPPQQVPQQQLSQQPPPQQQLSAQHQQSHQQLRAHSAGPCAGVGPRQNEGSMRMVATQFRQQVAQQWRAADSAVVAPGRPGTTTAPLSSRSSSVQPPPRSDSAASGPSREAPQSVRSFIGQPTGVAPGAAAARVAMVAAAAGRGGAAPVTRRTLPANTSQYVPMVRPLAAGGSPGRQASAAPHQLQSPRSPLGVSIGNLQAKMAAPMQAQQQQQQQAAVALARTMQQLKPQQGEATPLVPPAASHSLPPGGRVAQQAQPPHVAQKQWGPGP
eukprot:CAMPEP_0176110538 /NCGR_PEP_ID=MMETSP0120_2-20121206/55506_1 /TAXON_ID=160619 /ORGANISM="Kryptoperidinium foliaceum, Strain CCMP 1326" /LENGTH=713 /DNA_ID=CAMNT_0017444745 /DNA_START=3 /DNA_END=2141 /DNA_ORIENTATION=-